MAFCLFNTVLCLFLIAVLYAIVSYELWLRRVPGEGNSRNQRQAEARRTAKRITLMMISIVLMLIGIGELINKNTFEQGRKLKGGR